MGQVYNGRGTLEEGETAETRFIKIQAAYELLLDVEKRRQYDMDNRVNPMKARSLFFLLIPFIIRNLLIDVSIIINIYAVLNVESTFLLFSQLFSVPQASQAWMDWLMKKRKAFDQRGDMAIAAWAEQQQREMSLRARRLSRSKVLIFFSKIINK